MRKEYGCTAMEGSHSPEMNETKEEEDVIFRPKERDAFTGQGQQSRSRYRDDAKAIDSPRISC